VREEDLEQVDLSSWEVAYNGAERISNETVNRFCERFRKYGFKESAMYPCYGLAEATLFVSGERLETRPAFMRLDRAALEQNVVRVVPVEELDSGIKTLESVACGKTWLGGEIAIIDPDSRQPKQLGQIGEICVGGPNVTPGYWNERLETHLTLSGANTPDTDHPKRMIRTGDLGFLDANNRLHVTGRLKELIILNGRKLYPEDIEFTARNADASVSGCHGAAFSVDNGDEEQLVVVQEVRRDSLRALSKNDVARRITYAITREYGVAVRKIILLRPNTIPVTSSGKIQRRRCRQLFLDGDLE
jgi:acyl-CoA synthetase (AMP-forming)/AMP-acid ligase II